MKTLQTDKQIHGRTNKLARAQRVPLLGIAKSLGGYCVRMMILVKTTSNNHEDTSEHRSR